MKSSHFYALLAFFIVMAVLMVVLDASRNAANNAFAAQCNDRGGRVIIEDHMRQCVGARP